MLGYNINFDDLDKYINRDQLNLLYKEVYYTFNKFYANIPIKPRINKYLFDDFINIRYIFNVDDFGRLIFYDLKDSKTDDQIIKNLISNL